MSGVSYGLAKLANGVANRSFSPSKSEPGNETMLKKLHNRIDVLFADTNDCLKAQLCLFTFRAKGKDCANLSDDELTELCKQFRIKLEHTSDQYAAVTCELQEMANSDPSKFGRDQVWTMLRAIKIQDQLLKLHIGGEPLNV